MYEIFTCGKCPFEELTNDAVLEHVKRGHILNKPENVSTRVYTVS